MKTAFPGKQVRQLLRSMVLGLPSPVSHCKYVPIKECVFQAPDLKTNSAPRLSRQPEDPQQTDTLPGPINPVSFLLQQEKFPFGHR